MRQTKKITLSAMIVALGAAFMVLGGFIEVLDLTACAFASVLVAFVYIEIGSPYTWLVWLGTSLATFLFGSMLWVQYFLIFGIYPILKAYIERLPRRVWFILKLAFINAMLWLIILAYELIFKLPFFVIDKTWIKVFVYLVMNVAFIAYDLFITVLIRLYFDRLRNRFKHLLK